jgi:tetratricopeptide (TPR) repeat protein
LGIAVLFAYSNSFRAGMIFDNAVLVQDPRIHALTPHNLFLILSGGYWYQDADTGLYRPLTTLSFLLNYVAFGNGPQPASYHWVNLALHEINVMLVYALGALVFERRGPSFALAALWGLHPLHTEAVTNVVGRADLLAAFGVLAGVLCYARCSRAEGRPRLGWVACLAAAQAIGVFSKESAAVLPGILMVYDSMTGTITGGKTACATQWRRLALPYIAVMVPLAACLWLRSGLGIHLLPNYVDNPIVGATFLGGRMTALKVLGKFVWLFLWPSRLSADYSYRAIPVLDWHSIGWEAVLALLTTACLLAGAWFAVSRRRTAKALYFFPLFFWIAYLPTSNLPIVIGSIMAERFLYLPSIGLTGWAVAAAWLVASAVLPPVRSPAPRPQRFWWGVLAFICLAFGAKTYSRNLDWTDERSLWASAVAVSPDSARAHNNLGTALPLDPDRLPEIIAEFEAAVRIRPDFAEAHNNLGNALLHMPGRLQDAVAEYQAAVRIRPGYAEAHNNLGNTLLHMPGRLDSAIAEYRAAVHIRPDDAEAHNNLGNALLEAPERLPDAIGEFEAAVRIRPDYAEAHYNLGIALLRIPNRLPEAIAQFEAALGGRPDFAEAHYNLGNSLLRAGRPEDAASHYEAALRLGPDLAEGHYTLARAWLQIPGRLPDAIAEFERALRLKPDFAEAHYGLAMALRRVPGREAEASRELAAAIRIRPELGHSGPARASSH